MINTMLCLLMVLASHAPLLGQGKDTTRTLYQVETIISQKPSSARANQIDVYPNPASDYIIVSIKKATIKDIYLELYSVIGKKVNIAPEKVGNDAYKFNLKDLNPGYYFVIAKNDIVQFKKGKKFLKR